MNQVHWIPVSERLPAFDQGVLVATKAGITCAEKWPALGWPAYTWGGHLFEGHEWNFDFRDYEVTHWAELPQPPAN